MQKNLQNLAVDLARLREEMVQFFDQEKFSEIVGVDVENGFKLIAGDSSRHKISRSITVTVKGKPDDFTVNLELPREEKKHGIPMMLSSMFGGGYFMLRNLKTEEAMLKFEPIFWKNLNRTVEHLQNTATSEPQDDTATTTNTR